MTRERRLGRGLEALLGRIAPQGEPAIAARPGPTATNPPQTADGPYGGATEEPYAGLAGPDRDARPAFLTPPRCESPAAASPPSTEPSADAGPPRVDVRQIDSNPFQPRQDFDEAETASLAESLRTHGLLQPVVVRRVGDRYQLIAGERRLRAAIHAGWSEVPVQVVEADDRQVAELAIIENLHRKDLNALEKAASFQWYLEQYGCTQEELASRLALDRSTVANLIRLMELPEAVQDVLRRGQITQGHARALLPLGDEREQIKFCQRVQEEALSVRQTEALVQETIEKADSGPIGVVGRDGAKSKPRRVASEHVASLEQELRASLGAKVTITHNSRGRGKLVIHFSSHTEFERIRDYLIGTDPTGKSQVG